MEELREKYLNPISGNSTSPEEIDQKIEAKLKEFAQSQDLKEAFLKMLKMLKENGNETYESKIVTTNEEELIQLSNKGYDCQIIGTNKCLMRKKV